MTEPLTDEQIEHLKKTTDIIGTPDNVYGLIARVESLKEELDRVTSQGVRGWEKVRELKEENKRIGDKLVDANIREQNTLEENAKLETQLKKSHELSQNIPGVGRYVCKFYKY